MGMLQASLFNVRPTAGVHQLHVKARRKRSRRIDSLAPRQLNPDTSVVRRDIGKDWAVVQQAIAGDADAQEHLFSHHTGRLYRTALAVLRNKEDAQDALQEGLCKAFTGLRSFQGRSSFSSWLTRIVINAALMARRSKKAHPELSLDEILANQSERFPHGLVDPRPDPEKTYAAIEANALVEQHVRQLPPDLKEAYHLRAINGLSTKDSCRVLGIPVSACKSRIFRARRKIASGLGQSPESVAYVATN
jgi:RNA polymerase sigma-70 factor, ECF subfamily